MNPGDLRDRIEIYSVLRDYDELGGATEAEVLKASAWASVRTPSTREGILAMQAADVRTHEVICRGGATAPVAGDIIVWAGTRLRVRGTMPDLKARLVIADCVGDKP